MVPNLFVRRVPAAVVAILLWNVAGTALSQQISAPLDSGFARTSSIDMSVDEMLGSRKTRALTEPILGPGYPELWIGEVQYKPVRLMRLEIRDPKTGAVKKELVRYMVYRMILRDPTELAGAETEELRRKLADPNLDPANTLDSNVTVPLQLPRFLLKTEDNDIQDVYVDEINLGRNFRRAHDPQITNCGLVRSTVSLQHNPGTWRRVHDLFVNLHTICKCGDFSIIDDDPKLSHRIPCRQRDGFIDVPGSVHQLNDLDGLQIIAWFS